MAKRICANCGKEKEVKKGKVCPNGHFICYSCITKDIGVFSGALKNCPLCGKKLS